MKARLPSGAALDLDDGRPDLESLGFHAAGYRFPEDSGSKVGMSRLLYRQVAGGGPVLIILLNVHIWPSSGHLPILTRLREAWGARQSLDDAPGHYCTEEESDDALSLLVLAFEFFWDCLVLSEDGQRAAYISHDEYWDFLSIQEQAIAEYKSVMEDN